MQSTVSSSSSSSSSSSQAPICTKRSLSSLFAPPPFSLLLLPPPECKELYAFHAYCKTSKCSRSGCGKASAKGNKSSSCSGSSSVGSDSENGTSFDFIHNIKAATRNNTLPLHHNNTVSSFSSLSLTSSASGFSAATPTSPIRSLTGALPKEASQSKLYQNGHHLSSFSSSSSSPEVRLVTSKSETFLGRIRPVLRPTRTTTLKPPRPQKPNPSKVEEPAQMISNLEQSNQRQEWDNEFESIQSSQIAAWNMLQDDCASGQVFRDIAASGSQVTDVPSLVKVPPSATLVGSHTCLSCSPTTMERESRGKNASINAVMTRIRWPKKGTHHTTRGSPIQFQSDLTNLGQIMEAEEDKGFLDASCLLGLSWGCAAKEVWDSKYSLKTYEINIRQIALDELVHSSPFEEAKVLDWPRFYYSYSQGLLDLSVMPLMPKGVPKFECCPDATPLSIGLLDAPIPHWEAQRVRSYFRLELRKLETEVLQVISAKVESCISALCVQKALLQCMEGNVVYRLTANGLVREDRSRGKSMSAHVILNRNKGMVVKDLTSDWRFESSKEEVDLHYYAGMPVVAANGLPVAVLSVWAKKRTTCIESHFLRRMAREIGQIFEDHHRKRWESKIRGMAKSIVDLERRLQVGERNQWCSGIQTEIVESPWDIDSSPASAFNGSLHQPGWSTTYNPIDLQALANMGLLISLEDVERLRITLGGMACQLKMESIYFAAVCLPWGMSSREQIYVLATHNLAATDELSYPFHQLLFAPPSPSIDNGGHSGMIKNDEDGSNRCYVRHSQKCGERKQNFMQDLQPIEQSKCRLEAMLILSLARRGKLGFVLGALTRSKTKVVGIEDFHYMEALRPMFCSTIDRFQHAFRSAQVEAVYEGAKRKAPTLKKVDSVPMMFGSGHLNNQANDRKRCLLRDVPNSTSFSSSSRPITPLEMFMMGSLNEAGLKPRPRRTRAKSSTSALVRSASCSQEKEKRLAM